MSEGQNSKFKKDKRNIAGTIAGIIYILLSYFMLKLLVSKFLKTDIRILHITINVKWIIIAIVLPVIVKGILLPIIMIYYR